MLRHVAAVAALSLTSVVAVAWSQTRPFDAGNPAAEAHAKLCSVNWWRTSANGPAVEALLDTPGVDPNHACNLGNDRPIHIPLKITNFVMLTGDIYYGMDALLSGGANLNVRNNAGDSAVGLAGIRYGGVRDRMTRHARSWCRGEMPFSGLYGEMARNSYDKWAYLYITSFATGQSLRQLRDEMLRELYQTEANGTIRWMDLCPHIGIDPR